MVRLLLYCVLYPDVIYTPVRVPYVFTPPTSLHQGSPIQEKI